MVLLTSYMSFFCAKNLLLKNPKNAHFLCQYFHVHTRHISNVMPKNLLTYIFFQKITKCTKKYSSHMVTKPKLYVFIFLTQNGKNQENQENIPKILVFGIQNFSSFSQRMIQELSMFFYIFFILSKKTENLWV